MIKRYGIIPMSIVVLISCVSFALAQGGDKGHDHGQKKDKAEAKEEGKCQMMGGGMGMETPAWKESLTEEQMMKADKMHLELKRAMGILEAKANLKEAELNGLITQDDPDTKAIQGAISEIMEIKKEMMLKKYDHILEMRSILTSEQRLSFDLGHVGGMGGMGGKGGKDGKHQEGHH